MNQTDPGHHAVTPATIAARMRGIASFHVMELLARAQQLQAEGRDVVHMEVGEPDFPTPPAVVEAAHRALQQGLTGYSPALGIPELREAIAGYYREQLGVTVDPRRIAVTPGASGALLLALGVTVDPGQAVLMADPGYPCNRHFVRMFGGRAVEAPAGAEHGYQLTPALAEAAWDDPVAAVMVATPSNPTGTTLAADDLRALHALCARRGAWFLVDEIYGGLVYDGPPGTVLELTDEALVINSFSKTFCMTGWRIGWLVLPEALVAEVDRLAQNVFLCPPRISQHAAVAAFLPQTRELVEQRRQAFAARRDFLLAALREIGFRIPVRPAGAFYIYADCSDLAEDAYELCWTLLEQAGVATTPGRDFGVHGADHHVRFAYTADIERLAEGVERIRRFLAAGA